MSKKRESLQPFSAPKKKRRSERAEGAWLQIARAEDQAHDLRRSSASGKTTPAFGSRWPRASPRRPARPDRQLPASDPQPRARMISRAHEQAHSTAQTQAQSQMKPVAVTDDRDPPHHRDQIPPAPGHPLARPRARLMGGMGNPTRSGTEPAWRAPSGCVSDVCRVGLEASSFRPAAG